MALSETIKTAPASTGRLDHIPGHMGLPIFGNTFEFLKDPFAFHHRRRQEHGSVYKFGVFGGKRNNPYKPKNTSVFLVVKINV